MRAEGAVLGLAASQRPWQCFAAPDKCGGHGSSKEGACVITLGVLILCRRLGTFKMDKNFSHG